jgi:hypothetical protein
MLKFKCNNLYVITQALFSCGIPYAISAKFTSVSVKLKHGNNALIALLAAGLNLNVVNHNGKHIVFNVGV